MHDGGAPDEGTITDSDMASKENEVGEDDVVAQDDIVGEVRPGHEDAIVSDLGGAVFVGAAMDGDVLANRGAISNEDAAGNIGRKTEILRQVAEDGTGMNGVFFAQNDPGMQDDMGMEDGVVSNLDLGGNDGISADADIVPQMCAGIDQSSGMDHGDQESRPASLKL